MCNLKHIDLLRTTERVMVGDIVPNSTPQAILELVYTTRRSSKDEDFDVVQSERDHLEESCSDAQKTLQYVIPDTQGTKIQRMTMRCVLA